jgi:dihydropteroate synthase
MPDGEGAALGIRSDASASGSISSDPRYWRSLPLGQRTLILGVINVTPDSISGDGVGADPRRAVDLGCALVAAGADALDVGGESTRPGATPVEEREELRRVVPAIEALAMDVAVPLSVDTMKAGVAQAALRAGASIVNDVSGLRADPTLAQAAASHDAALILGHWAQARWHAGIPPGADPAAIVAAHLGEAARRAMACGLLHDAVWLDPGLGFGKRVATSLALVRGIEQVVQLGHFVVIGPSRKRFIGETLKRDAAEDWEGAAALVALAIAAGVHVVRVHDVGRLARVARMTDAVLEAAESASGA